MNSERYTSNLQEIQESINFFLKIEKEREEHLRSIVCDLKDIYPNYFNSDYSKIFAHESNFPY